MSRTCPECFAAIGDMKMYANRGGHVRGRIHRSIAFIAEQRALGRGTCSEATVTAMLDVEGLDVRALVTRGAVKVRREIGRARGGVEDVVIWGLWLDGGYLRIVKLSKAAGLARVVALRAWHRATDAQRQAALALITMRPFPVPQAALPPTHQHLEERVRLAAQLLRDIDDVLDARGEIANALGNWDAP